MTDDIARGKAKQVEGKARQKAGDLTDDHSEEVKGVAKQFEGKIQEGIGKIKKKIDDRARSAVPANLRPAILYSLCIFRGFYRPCKFAFRASMTS